MSVNIEVLKDNDLYDLDPHQYPAKSLVGGFENVIGYVVAAVVKQADGAVTLEREISVYADSAEDNELAEHVVKDIEAALNSIFPDPNKPVPSKLWTP